MPNRDPEDLFTPAPLPVAPLDADERLACLRLIRSSQVGPVTFRELINHCGGARQALAALPQLSRRAGRPARVCSEADAEAELKAAEKAGARPVFTIEPGYPQTLAALDTPPPMVYLKGRSELLGLSAIAVVGSRQASAAGLKLARLFARRLAEAGFSIVSGLARGVDAAAHEASLMHGTVAVLAGGIDIVYPPEHASLQARIGEEGCLVTELPPGFVPRGRDFPRRNRLVSGLSRGVVVIEAARRSGSLVTARLAGEQGREIFAVPGHPLDPRAEGTNQLLKSGATLVTQPEDVIDALGPQLHLRPAGMTEETSAPVFAPAFAAQDVGALDARGEPTDSERARVLAALGPHPVDIDTLARAIGLGAREVRVLLLDLDLAGEIARHGSQLVSRTIR
ncbi:DNA processing protein DprA [Hyphomicrobium nitrativorans NL23]|uniref:DNA processing protein DprA n=1 Tax=Hyphomicrobium nitrativorans NL23 TaxID=1029756 RepID=V5SEV3_9HYPH|nr:DNA-processing protein DprA [Hyphomicrobium nitrativorans]AHB49391.1 DNA processing protein DprA [Hyphomicrobium nitrativorans NL23]